MSDRRMIQTAAVACFIGIVLVSPSLSETCTQISPCACQTSQGLLDLSPLASRNGTPRFQDVPGPAGAFFYSYSPCDGFSNGSGPCQDVAVCQTDNSTMSFSLGAANSTVFKNSTNGWQVVYTSLGSPTRTSTVTLVCDPNEPGNFTAQGENPQGSANYFFTLTSSNACFNPNDTTPTPTTTSTTTSTTDGSAAPRSLPHFLCILSVYIVGVSCKSMFSFRCTDFSTGCVADRQLIYSTRKSDEVAPFMSRTTEQTHVE
ncbi:uncharacterized protein [Haliotis cracherodii]|uniref:uncharacterized protein n=1 Tax=Haliotis cracherodii TaxID=6455 RepID=UPI0039ED6B41